MIIIKSHRPRLFVIVVLILNLLDHNAEARVTESSLVTYTEEGKAQPFFRPEFLQAVDCFSVSYILGTHINDRYWLLGELGLGEVIIKTSNKFVGKMKKSNSLEKDLVEKLVEIQLIKDDGQSKKIEGNIASLIGSDLFNRYFRCQFEALLNKKGFASHETLY